MSTRRPRIKAAAILPPKRPREGSTAATAAKQPKIENKTELIVKVIPSLKEKVSTEQKSTPAEVTEAPDAIRPGEVVATTSKPAVEEVAKTPERDKLFKYPPTVANHKRSESFSTSDIEIDQDNSSQNDALRNLQGPLSPVKFRQRIRPTPFFGMRRNSTQGYGSDIEEEPKRQRHTSTSSNTAGTPIPQRMRQTGQRIRTESSCSAFSDISRELSSKPTRKSAPSEEYLRALAAKKEFLSRFNGKIPEKSHMKMSDLIYYNPTTNPMIKTDQQKATIENNAQEAVAVKPPPLVVEEEPATPEKETCMPVPQLKLGPNGEMILDEQSLVIETTAEKEARATLANSNVIYMDEFTGNNGFYRRTKRTKEWPADETIKFYRCLHTVGTDFSLMLTLFPNRSRRDLKLKFKKEERLNLNLINKALLYPKAFNIADLKQELDKEQEELDAKQKEWLEIKKKNAAQKKKKGRPKQFEPFSKIGRALQDGDFIYETDVINYSSNEQSPAIPIQNVCNKEMSMSENEQEPTSEAITENRLKPATKKKPKPKLAPRVSKKLKNSNLIVSENGETAPAHPVEPQSTSSIPISVIIDDATLQKYKNDRIIIQKIENPTNPLFVENLSSLNTKSLHTLHPMKMDNEIIDSSGTRIENYSYTTIDDYDLNDNTIPSNQVQIFYDQINPTKLNDCNLTKTSDLLDEIPTTDRNGNSTDEEPEECESIVKLPDPHVPKVEQNDRTTETDDDSAQAVVVYVNGDEPNEENVTIPKDVDIDTEMERFMLHDLGNILTNLIMGTLVVVASEDENDSSKVINEIYVMCKETGALSDKPLDLPEDVVNCIIEELNATS